MSAEAFVLSYGAVGGFNKRRSQGAIAVASFSAFAFGRALVLSRTKSDPGSKVVLVRKSVHVGAGFGKDDLRQSPIDARSVIKPIEIIVFLAQKSFDLGI